DDRHAVERFDAVAQVARLRQPRRSPALAELAASLLELRLERGDAVRHPLRRGRARGLGRAVQERETSTQVRIRPGARERLDPAHPGTDALLAGDDEAPDLAAGPAVRAAA